MKHHQQNKSNEFDTMQLETLHPGKKTQKQKTKTTHPPKQCQNGDSSSHATFIPGNKAFLIEVLRDNDGEFHPVLTRRVF